MRGTQTTERIIPHRQEVWQHFKGNFYIILCVAQHTETNEKLVIYRPDGARVPIHARPLDMFMSEVDHEKYPNAEQKYRFERVSY